MVVGDCETADVIVVIVVGLVSAVSGVRGALDDWMGELLVVVDSDGPSDAADEVGCCVVKVIGRDAVVVLASGVAVFDVEIVDPTAVATAVVAGIVVAIAAAAVVITNPAVAVLVVVVDVVFDVDVNINGVVDVDVVAAS